MKIAALFALGLTLSQHAGTAEWSQLPEILTGIVAPEILARDFNITNFGSVADGKTDASPAISHAIDACVKAGGGRVPLSAAHADGSFA